MPLTEEDYENLRAERNADPERFRAWDSHDRFRTEYASLHSENQQSPEGQAGAGRVETETEVKNEIERIPTASSSSSSATSAQYAGIRARPSNRHGRSDAGYSHDPELHRSDTHMINSPLESHPTALDRINTHRSLHYGTVGSRSSSKRKDFSLPKFGGGKPYPPPLPAREEYVVEFDGHDDPSHAQNWSLRKKFVTASAPMVVPCR